MKLEKSAAREEIKVKEKNMPRQESALDNWTFFWNFESGAL